MNACVVIMILLVVVLASLCTTISCKKEGYVLSPGGEKTLEGGLSVCPGATVPIGTIVPFYQAGKDGKLDKSVIPFGWWICDGSPDPDTGVVTPNLSGKYLMGANSSKGLTMMNTSSTFETTLTENQVPLRSHSHTQTNTDPRGLVKPRKWSGGSGSYPATFSEIDDSGNIRTEDESMAATEPLKIEFDQYIPNFPIVYIMYVGTKKKDRACADIRVT